MEINAPLDKYLGQTGSWTSVQAMTWIFSSQGTRTHSTPPPRFSSWLLLWATRSSMEMYSWLLRGLKLQVVALRNTFPPCVPTARFALWAAAIPQHSSLHEKTAKLKQVRAVALFTQEEVKQGFQTATAGWVWIGSRLNVTTTVLCLRRWRTAGSPARREIKDQHVRFGK